MVVARVAVFVAGRLHGRGAARGPGGVLHQGRVSGLATDRRLLPDPLRPRAETGDPITITRDEFDEAYDRLSGEGVPLKADRDHAWVDFAGWRVNYDTGAYGSVP
jgi:hypothetical protein